MAAPDELTCSNGAPGPSEISFFSFYFLPLIWGQHSLQGQGSPWLGGSWGRGEGAHPETQWSAVPGVPHSAARVEVLVSMVAMVVGGYLHGAVRHVA